MALAVAVAVAFVLAVVRVLRHRALVNARGVAAAAVLFVLNCLIWAV